MYLLNCTFKSICFFMILKSIICKLEITSTESYSVSSNLTSNSTGSLGSSDSTTSSLITTTDYVTLKSRKSNLDVIANMLRKQEADKCIYGKNPKLYEICPSLLKTEAFKSISNRNISLINVRDSILNKTVVSELKNKCIPGEWCLPNDILLKEDTPVNVKKIKRSSEIVCMLASCMEEASYYIDKCVDSEISRNILFMSSAICNKYNNTRHNDYCHEHSMRLIHVTIAAYVNTEPNRLPENNVCYDNILRKKCPVECKHISADINRLDSCCVDSSIIKSFKSLGWYHLLKNEVEEYCNLPITSICWSDGKYFVGISPNLLIIIVVSTVGSTTFLLLVIYLFCCKTGSTFQQNFNDSYQYSVLQNGEEEIGLENNSFTDLQEKDKSRKYEVYDYEIDDTAKLFDENNNQKISEFMNQRKSDI